MRKGEGMRRRWVRTWEVRKRRAGLVEIAKNLFKATGKDPYHREDKVISNFEELREGLAEFTESEAPWVASWIEYLGDAETAQKIRAEPSRFKEIITDRYYELKALLVKE